MGGDGRDIIQDNGGKIIHPVDADSQVVRHASRVSQTGVLGTMTCKFPIFGLYHLNLHSLHMLRSDIQVSSDFSIPIVYLQRNLMQTALVVSK